MLRNTRLAIPLCFAIALTAPALATDWMQDAGNAQRSGYTPEAPDGPWQYLWGWNGPNSTPGTTDQHFYNAPREARTITGGSYIYAPAGGNGLYALGKRSGQVGWSFTQAAVNATPAYDPITGCVYAGGANGTLYKIDAGSGNVLGSYSAGGPLNKSVLLAGGSAYVTNDAGQLHRVNLNTMEREWMYTAGSGVATPPTYSAAAGVILYGTDDLNVHAVNVATGDRKWRVKPTNLSPGYPNEYEFGWPVVAEQHGVVFMRMNMTSNQLWSGPLQGGAYPTTNGAIRQHLTNNPQWQSLFALDLETGQKKFIPAVGPGFVEAYNNGPVPHMGTQPVVKVLPDGKEVVYMVWRNGQTQTDGRWDSVMGEMVLDDETVPGYQAGDLRFVDFPGQHLITDEQCPITVAGDTIFHAHWGFSDSATITDRSDDRGDSYTDPIRVTKNPSVVRRQDQTGTPNTQTHWTTAGLRLEDDGRYRNGPGWWAYWNVVDPPASPAQNAYSAGFLPRYTYVADGLIIVEGNGGDLMIFSHSGDVPVTLLGGDADGNGTVDLADLAILATNWNATAGRTWGHGDFDGDRAVGLSDLAILATNWNVSVAGVSFVDAAREVGLGDVVPEPATLTLALAGLGLAAMRRRR